MRKLSIGIIMQSPDIGGAETYMCSLIDQFLKNKCNVSFASNNQRLISLIDSSEVKKVNIPYIIDIIGDWKGLIKAIFYLPLALNFYISLLKSFKKEGIDVILMSGFGEKMLVTYLARLMHIPVVWIEYGPLYPVFVRNFGIPKIIYKLLISYPRSIIVPSENTKYSLIGDANVDPRKLWIVPCGTAIPVSRKKLKLTKYSNKFVIGNVSRLTTEKGQQVIIRAAKKIIKKIPNSFFILVGDGPDKTYFETMIKEERLNDYFDLPGFVDDIEHYYGNMDIFIFPTVWDLEGFGLVSVEAMMRGIPVIASNIGPVPEIVKNNYVGKLFKVNNSDDLADKVIKMASDIKYRQKLSANAEKYAKENFNIEIISKQILVQLYNACRR